MVTAKMSVGIVALVAMMSVTAAIPSYYYPPSWTAQDIDAFEKAESVRYTIRPREVSSQTFNTDNQDLGMVSAVAVDSGGWLFVFHRADKPWVAETFTTNSNTLSEEAKKPIGNDTIFVFHPNTGRKLTSFGGGLFNVPHGLTIDAEDNIWVTDVGRHQVIRFPKGSTIPDLELGIKFESGSDDLHFCKPTDVAVASNGDFFVSDGYCNSRVLKFSKNGTFLTKWGTATNQRQDTADGPDPFNLAIPHSLTLVEELDLICVADREHQRALCYNAGINTDRPVGSFNKTLIPEGEMGKVFAIYYNQAAQNVIAAAEISRVPVLDNQGRWSYPARAFTYNLAGQEMVEWAFITPNIAAHGPSLIHDICSSKDGRDFFLGDITQRKIFKYTLAPNPQV